MSDYWTKAQEQRFGHEDCVDEEALKNPIQRERIDKAVKFVGGPGLKVLDVGCSAGGISELIHNNGNECWGIDLPDVVARVPEERKKWFNVRHGDASRKPWAAIEVPVASTTSGTLGMTKWSSAFDDAFFDVCFLGEIIEHFIDLEPPLTEAWRVLKPGGRLVLTTPNVAREINRLFLLFGDIEVWHEWKRIPHHVRFFTPNTLAMALEKYRFKPTRWEYGRSQAELGNDVERQNELSPIQKIALKQLFDHFTPGPLWKHSFLIVDAEKVG